MGEFEFFSTLCEHAVNKMQGEKFMHVT